MTLDLTEEETDALARLLSRTIDDDRYPLSARIQMLKAILAKIRPETVREPLPPLRRYEPSRATAARRRRSGALTLKSEPGPPMKLGNAAAARVRLIVWCRDCNHQGRARCRGWLLGTAPKRRLSIGASG
jgi:hypothetical protein